jgi:hypothetical protein
MMKPMLFAAALVAFLPLCIIGHVVPPHPDFAEEYHRIRRRKQRRSLLRSSKNSTKPVVIVDGPVDPRFCHDLSESECRRLNALFGKSAATTLSVLKEKRTLATLVLLMRFTDHSSRELPSRDQMDVLWNSNQLTTQFPTGSIARYLEKNSYDKISVQASVIDWVLTDNTEKHYSFDGTSGLTRKFADSIVPLLQQLDYDNYDFSKHDLNGDMVIDNLAVRIK